MEGRKLSRRSVSLERQQISHREASKLRCDTSARYPNTRDCSATKPAGAKRRADEEMEQVMRGPSLALFEFQAVGLTMPVQRGRPEVGDAGSK
jgi:hypothetical protein